MSKKGYDAWSQLEIVESLLRTLLRLAREHHLRAFEGDDGSRSIQVHHETYFQCRFESDKGAVQVVFGDYRCLLSPGTEAHDMVVRLLASTDSGFRRSWLADSQALADVERRLTRELRESRRPGPMRWSDGSPGDERSLVLAGAGRRVASCGCVHSRWPPTIQLALSPEISKFLPGYVEISDDRPGSTVN